MENFDDPGVENYLRGFSWFYGPHSSGVIRENKIRTGIRTLEVVIGRELSYLEP